MGITSQAQTIGALSEPRLRIRTLGGLSFHAANDEPMHSTTALRRPAAVLVAVAAAGERGISRDKLLGLLWPDSHPERARHSLTQAIYNARRVTGIDDLFLTDGVLRVNPARVSSDFEEFESAFADGDDERAAAVYGGPFLDGFYVSDSADFEQWVSAQRARLEESMATVLERLATRAATASDWRRAVEWRRRQAALRPFDSAVAVSLVSALAQAGDRAGALQQAEWHVELLREHLGLEPDPSLADALAALREPIVTLRRADVAPTPLVAMASPENVTPNDAASAIPHDPASPFLSLHLRRRWMLAGAAAVVLASLTFWRDASSRPTDHQPLAASAEPTLWVAPFDVSGASPSVEYLGRGVAQLLTVRLDNISDERSFDAGIVNAAWRDAGFDKLRDVARDSVLQLAGERGAQRVIIGSVVGDRARAVLSASVFAVANDSVLATATVEGSADSVSVLATRLAAKLLVSEAHDDSTLVRWDTPIAALSAFLDGHQLYHQSSFMAAAREYREALSIDSTFVPAALQLARVADRIGDAEMKDAAIARAWQHRAKLDEGSRTVLIALAGPRYPAASSPREALDAWAHVVHTWPQRAGSWYELGARLAHDGRRLGVEGSGEQALAALNHAIVLEPDYKPARDLLAHLALRPAAQSDRSLSSFHSDPSSSLAPFLRWRAAVAHHDTTEQLAVRDDLASLNSENLRAIAMASQFDAVGLEDGMRAIDLLAARATNAAERVDATLAAHSLALNTGNTAEALAQTTRLRDLRPDSHAYLRLRVLDALYAAGDTTAARVAATELAAPVDSLFRDFPLLRTRVAADACVLAQWRLAHRDTAEVRAIISLLRARDVGRADQPIAAAPAICGDLVEAQIATLAKRREAAALVDRLDGLVLTSAVAGNLSQYANIAISRMYIELGNPRRALTAIRKRDYMSGWPAYLGTVWRDELRLARLVGDSRRAIATDDRISGLRAGAAAIVLSIPER